MSVHHTKTKFNNIYTRVGVPITELIETTKEKCEKVGVTRKKTQHNPKIPDDTEPLDEFLAEPFAELLSDIEDNDIAQVHIPQEVSEVMPEVNQETKRYVMYILVNTDLKMEKGKIAGQVGHVVGIITEEIIRKAYESVTPESMQDYQHYKNWIKKDMYTKVVLKATEAEMRNIIKTENKCRYIIDAERTQIAPDSLTVVGFFPRNDLEEKMKGYNLL